MAALASAGGGAATGEIVRRNTDQPRVIIEPSSQKIKVKIKEGDKERTIQVKAPKHKLQKGGGSGRGDK